MVDVVSLAGAMVWAMVVDESLLSVSRGLDGSSSLQHSEQAIQTRSRSHLRHLACSYSRSRL